MMTPSRRVEFLFRKLLLISGLLCKKILIIGKEAQ
jgi:hypothetical protein